MRQEAQFLGGKRLRAVQKKNCMQSSRATKAVNVSTRMGQRAVVVCCVLTAGWQWVLWLVEGHKSGPGGQVRRCKNVQGATGGSKTWISGLLPQSCCISAPKHAMKALIFAVFVLGDSTGSQKLTDSDCAALSAQGSSSGRQACKTEKHVVSTLLCQKRKAKMLCVAAAQTAKTFEKIMCHFVCMQHSMLSRVAFICICAAA